MVKIREATWLDLLMLTPHLREADRQECEALMGKGALETTVSSTFAHSAAFRYTIEDDGLIIGMFGVASGSLLGGIGVPWMFGNEVLYTQSRRVFINEGRRYIAKMLELFPRLENVVDARNGKAIRFLKHLGFRVLPAMPMGAEKQQFHPFVMEA